MTERALLVKFATHGDYAAIGVEAPSAVRVFRISDASLLYTASAIPATEMFSAGGNGNVAAMSLHSHSTINETLTALAMASSSSSAAGSDGDFTCNLILATSSGRVSLFDCVAGVLRWSSFVADGSNVPVRAVASIGSLVFASTARHTLNVFNALSGRVVFTAGSSIVRGGGSAAGVNANSVELSNAKSLAACEVPTGAGNNNNGGGNVVLFVGGLQPVAYRMASLQQQQQQQAATSVVLEPLAFCRAQQAPCDHVSVSAVGGNTVLGTTACYSEGIVRVWRLAGGQQQQQQQQHQAVCIRVCDIAASPLLSSHHQQRLSHVSLDWASGKLVASTVSGSMFLWKNATLSAAAATASEALTATAPTATLCSPALTQEIAGDNNVEEGSSRGSGAVVSATQQRNGRIVAAFFFQKRQQQFASADSATVVSKSAAAASVDDSSVVVLRRNWTQPIFQPWRWSELLPSSSASAEGAATEAPRVLPAVTFAAGAGGRGEDSATAAGEDGTQQQQQQQRRRVVHLPQSTGKLSASAALKGLDLPTAGAFAFPKVQLRGAADMGQLPSSRDVLAAAGSKKDEFDDEDGQDERAQVISSAAAGASATTGATAGVAPALYQALHADDVPLVMEILSVGGRTQADRDATVQALSLRYVVQLVHLLSQRLTAEGAKSALHVWIATVMKLRGRELFAVIVRGKQQQQHTSSSSSSVDDVDAASLQAALLPLLEHYRGILSTVGSKVAFAAGRSSVFRSVRRRVEETSRSRRGQRTDGTAGVGLIGGTRFVENERGVFEVGQLGAASNNKKRRGGADAAAMNPDELETMLEGDTYNKMRRRKQKEKKLAKKRRAQKRLAKKQEGSARVDATHGGLVDDYDGDEDGEDDELDAAAASSSKKKKFRHAPEDGDDEDGDLDFDDDDDSEGGAGGGIDDYDDEDDDDDEDGPLFDDEEGDEEGDSDLENVDMDEDEAALLREIDAERDEEGDEEEDDDGDDGAGGDDTAVAIAAAAADDDDDAEDGGSSSAESGDDVEEMLRDDDEDTSVHLPSSKAAAANSAEYRRGARLSKKVNFD